METFELFPGVTLRCVPDQRFKQGCMSIQLLRPMCRQEAALNALLPAVLLRGSAHYPDLRDITLRMDDLYGTSVGPLVRRVGDCQTTGLYAGFMEDRFAMAGDRILEPVAEFLRELLLQPRLEDGVFCADLVESEKKNLISTIESQLNDKRAWAMSRLLRGMCREDSYGIPRLGEKENVAEITPKALWEHYRMILKTSPIDVFYVGSMEPKQVAPLVRDIFASLDRDYVPMPAQTPFRWVPAFQKEETMDVNQGKLCMGFVTPVTCRDDDYMATQMFNVIFGGGMTSKLFTEIREKQSLCYAIGSGYYSSKGIITVSAGIDSHMGQQVQQKISEQLEACRRGEITPQEMTAAREALRSSFLATNDSPGAIENYYANAVISGRVTDPESCIRAVEETTPEQVRQAALRTQFHSMFFLKGVGT